MKKSWPNWNEALRSRHPSRSNMSLKSFAKLIRTAHLRGRCDFYGFLLDISSCLAVPAWMLQASYIMSWPVELCGRPFLTSTRIAMTSSPVTRRELHP